MNYGAFPNLVHFRPLLLSETVMISDELLTLDMHSKAQITLIRNHKKSCVKDIDINCQSYC